MKTICMLVVLACVAPAMAVDFYEIPADGNYGTTASTGFNYNPTPDPMVLQDWVDNTYVAPYSSFVPTPYYEPQGAGPTTFTDGTAEVRFNMITARLNVSSDMDVATMYMGDTYWPLNYGAFGGTYSSQTARQVGGNVSIGTMNLGHDNTEWQAADMATNTVWNVREGSLDIGTLNQLNTNTDVGPYGLTCNTITAGGSYNDDYSSITVDIGTMNLNDTMTFLHVNAGTWNVGEINGDASNLTIALIGYDVVELAAALPGNETWDRPPEEQIGSLVGELTLPYDDLMAVVDAGNFYNFGGHAGVDIDYQDLDSMLTSPASASWAIEGGWGILITRANMDTFVDVTVDGLGMATVHTVPEPATMVLLGLGALVLRRKR